MRYLFRGGESKERFELMMPLTKINSDDKIAALYDHLVRGFTISQAAEINGLKPQNLNVALDSLEAKIEIHEKLKAHDWAHIKGDK